MPPEIEKKTSRCPKGSSLQVVWGSRQTCIGSPGENSHHGRWWLDGRSAEPYLAFESSLASDQNRQQMDKEFSLSEELADQMCAGIVIRNLDSDPLQFHQQTRIGALHPRWQAASWPVDCSTLGIVLSRLKVCAVLVGSVLGSRKLWVSNHLLHHFCSRNF